MTSIRIRAAVVLALIVGTVAAAHAWRPTIHLADSRPKVNLETLFPTSFGDWRMDERGPVQVISPDMQATIDRIYNQILSRTYVNSKGDRVMLSVAYGGDQSDATRAHRPEVCYPAQGFQILDSDVSVLELADRRLKVKHLVSRLGGRNEPLTYWLTVGERATLTGTETKLAQLSYSTRGLIPDGMLVRVSTIDADSANAFRVQHRFLSAMAEAIKPELRSTVVGDAGT